MSLRAIIDTIVQLESFRNVDLFQQGLYCINCSISHTLGKATYPGSPCFFHSGDDVSRTIAFPAEMDEQIFRSKTFLIKYSDEEIDLNDIGVFRSEIELLPGYRDANLILKVELLHQPVDLFKNVDIQLSEPTSFQTLSSINIEISAPMQGVNSFFPVCFGESAYGLVNTSVHSMLVDFRFRLTRMYTPKEEQEKSLMMNTLSDEQSHLPTLLSEYLFGDKKQLSDGFIDKVFESLASKLKDIFVKNRSLLSLWCDQELLDLALVAPLDEDDPRMHQLVSTKVEIREPEAVAELILQHLQVYSEKMCHLLIVFVEAIKASPKTINLYFQNEYNDSLLRRVNQCVFRNTENVQDYDIIPERSTESHSEAANNLRKSPHFVTLEKLPLQSTNMFPDPQWHPILFVDVSSRSPESIVEWQANWLSYISYKDFFNKQKHVIVLVHGFQGNSNDVRMIKNYITMIRPDLIMMSSFMNEGETDGDINAMGERLAYEVKDFLDQWCPSNLGKISFIGHSLGGVIIRAALPHLEELSERMHFFLTLSSPHLGYMHNSSRLVDAGMWYLKKQKKNVCIKQLSMTDNKDPRESVIYGLSKASGIEWFKFLILVSSEQDTYSPLESSRIQPVNSEKKDAYFLEMAHNLLSRIQAQRIYRVDVNFRIKGQNLDNLIGRAAHIQMLDNDTLFMMIFNSFPFIFE